MMNNRKNFSNRFAFVLFIIIMLSVCISTGFSQIKKVRGQVVYVPVYSHIYYGDRENYFLLSSTLSIRNTDFDRSLMVRSVEYYNTEGVLLEKMISKPTTVKSMETIRFVIKESDVRGGSGAKFIIRWSADAPVNEPIIEAVMIGTRNQQGISFTSRGQIIEESR